MKIRVTVLPKTSILDPQGAATAGAIKQLGWENPGRIRVGKLIEIDAAHGRPDDDKLHAICRNLLSNPVVEDYSIEFVEK